MTATAVETPTVPARGKLLHPHPAVRRLTWITLVNTVGSGLSMTLAALFFTRGLGFGVASVGTVLTAAGLCGVLAGVPAGRAADRWGVKPVLVVLTVGQAVGTLGYALVDGFAAFAVVACLTTTADRGATAVRAALYAEVLPADQRVAGRAYLRSVTNVGISVGTLLAAFALQADTKHAYQAAILADGVSFAVVAVMYLVLVPGGVRAAAAAAPEKAAGGKNAAGKNAAGKNAAGKNAAGKNAALRNLPFLAVTLLNGLLCLQFAVVEVGLPLWTVRETHAPRVMVAGSLLVNTALVIALQVRATRGTEEPAGAARIFARGGLLVAAACVVLGLAHGLPGWAAALMLAAGVGLQALGEVFSQAGGWALGYDLAEQHAQGAYQGVFSSGTAASMMLGPVLVTTVVIGYGLVGWLLMAALFTAAALAMAPTVRWAQTARA